MRDGDLAPVLSRRLRSAELLVLDGVAAALYAGVMTAIVSGRRPPGDVSPAWTIGLTVAATAPLAVRRRWPVTVFAGVLAASLSLVALDIAEEPLAGTAFALYAVALTRARPRATIVIAVVTAVVLAAGMLSGSAVPMAVDLGWLVTSGVALGAAWTLGQAIRDRRIAMAHAAARLADRAVAEERLRIARDLHDIVSHTLSLIGVKAGIARHLAPSRPDDVLDALAVIEEASRDALDQMRHMLGVLRANDDSPPGHPGTDHTGTDQTGTGLGGLPVLAGRVRLAGVAVDLRVHVSIGLSNAVESTVYHLVREALTNVVRHAAPTTCRVLIEAESNQVLVKIIDDGPGGTDGRGAWPVGRRAGAPGHGLVGMRERVLAHGGTFAAGPTAHSGFLVHAQLPVDKPGGST